MNILSAGNDCTIIKPVTFLGACLALILVGCATGPKNLSLQGPVDLRIQGQSQREDTALVRSHTIETTYDQGQLTQEREEAVDFTVVVKTIEVQPGNKIHQKMTVTDKNGNVDLHTMAYPELGEELEITMTPRSEILKSGTNSPDSIFFVPPIPIPDKPVAVGDTWTMTWNWLSSSKIPLQLELIGILKGVYACGAEQQGKCALLELSGDVSVHGQELVGLSMESKLSGYIYYAIQSGSVIWSDIRNKESLVSQAGNRVDIDSCLEAVLIEPAAEHWPYSSKPSCMAKKEIDIDNIFK